MGKWKVHMSGIRAQIQVLTLGMAFGKSLNSFEPSFLICNMRVKTRPVVNFFIHLRQINYIMDAGIVRAGITKQRIEMCAKSFSKM